MRLILLSMSLLFLASCAYIPALDKAFPDKRDEYKKSQSLPDLEVPPDLTADAINDSMAIPNEGAATLSGYRQSRAGGAVQQVPAGEQWLAINGAPAAIWPRLRAYFETQGYDIELDDAELGVFETAWSEPVVEDGLIYRHRFKIFSEQGEAPGNTVLYLSSDQQEQITRVDGSLEWIERGKGTAQEALLAGDLKRLFSAATSSTPPGRPARGTATVASTDDGRLFLTIPEEFTRAWRRTEESLNRIGSTINSKDPGKGLFFITHFDPDAGKKKGWLARMKFWGKDEPEGVAYRISLTGVGETTELVVLDEEGNWESDARSDAILSSIQTQYNQ